MWCCFLFQCVHKLLQSCKYFKLVRWWWLNKYKGTLNALWCYDESWPLSAKSNTALVISEMWHVDDCSDWRVRPRSSAMATAHKAGMGGGETFGNMKAPLNYAIYQLPPTIDITGDQLSMGITKPCPLFLEQYFLEGYQFSSSHTSFVFSENSFTPQLSSYEPLQCLQGHSLPGVKYTLWMID